MEIDKFRVDLYPHQFLTGTMKLKPDVRGIYAQIIMLIYIHRGRLEQDYVLIKNAANCSMRKAKAVVSQLIEMEKLRVDDDGYLVNNRAENVLKDVRKRSEKALNSRRKQTENEAKSNKIKGKNKKSNPLESESDKEDTNVSSPPTPQRGSVVVPDSFAMPDGTFLSLDGLFDLYWRNYPSIRDKGHKGKAKEEFIKKLKKGISHEDIGRGIKKYRSYCEHYDEKQPDMFRWIRDEGWNRDYEISAAKTPNGGRNTGYSIQSALDQALADTTRRPLSPERRKELELDDDTSDV